MQATKPVSFPLLVAALLVVTLFALLAMGCEIVISGEGSSSSSLPSASTIIREADRQGIDPYELLDRYYEVRKTELEDRASKLRARAPENQKRRYDIELERDIGILDLERRDRSEQIDRRLTSR